jgi:hypothetical protein
VALVIATCMAAAPLDTAVIVDSGSTNTYGFTMNVSSDGKGSVTLQTRGGPSGQSPKTFTVPSATTAKFFKDVAAAKKANAATVPCMKSASFGSSIHVTWQGWTSPDLTCPPKDSVGEALVEDVDAIRHAAGVSDLPLSHQSP